MRARPYWETKSLAEMSPSEWEALCDGCGLCCLVRFEDEDSGRIVPTRVACRLFDDQSCRCKDYESRHAQVPDCIKLSPGNVGSLPWMPASCAYRRLHEGKGLPRWHPLITGDPQSVHAAGVSVQGQTIDEASLADPDDALNFSAPELMRDRGDD